jgi:hypothetical protein
MYRGKINELVSCVMDGKSRYFPPNSTSEYEINLRRVPLEVPHGFSGSVVFEVGVFRRKKLK